MKPIAPQSPPATVAPQSAPATVGSANNVSERANAVSSRPARPIMLKEKASDHLTHFSEKGKTAKTQALKKLFPKTLGNLENGKLTNLSLSEKLKLKALSISSSQIKSTMEVGRIFHRHQDDIKAKVGKYREVLDTNNVDKNLSENDKVHAIKNMMFMMLGPFCLNKGVDVCDRSEPFSSIYVHTDPLLDAHDISSDQKKEFVKNISLGILSSGTKELSPALTNTPYAAQELRVYELIGEMMEDCPEKYKSAIIDTLIDINKTQAESTKQAAPEGLSDEEFRSHMKNLSDEDVAKIDKIDRAKGAAAAVICIVFSAAKHDIDAPKEVLDFMESCGELLQACDDLADYHKDFADRIRTPAMIHYEKEGSLDSFVSGWLDFINEQKQNIKENVPDEYQKSCLTVLDTFKVKLMGCVDSGKSEKEALFTPEYLQNIQDGQIIRPKLTDAQKNIGNAIIKP